MEQSRKRQPLLADRYLRAPRDKMFLSRALDQIDRGLRMARKYVFDEDACRKIADIVMQEPQLLIREHHLAIAPFDQTWIEWPSWHYWMRMREALGEKNQKNYISATTGLDFDDPETADYEVGYLFDNGRVNTIMVGKPGHPFGNTPQLCHIQYRLNTEWPVEDQLEFCRNVGLSRMGIDAWMWGSTWNDLEKEERRILRGNNVGEFVPINDDDPRRQQYWNKDGARHDVMRGSAGDMRTIIALLLILNRHNIATETRTVQRSKGFIRGKMITHSSHTTVRINLDNPAKELRESVATGHGKPLRRHERSGSFRTNQVAKDYARIAGCLHEWVEADEKFVPLTERTDSPRRWVCAACGGKQWFVDSYWTKGQRGGGIVIHDEYEVTC